LCLLAHHPCRTCNNTNLLVGVYSKHRESCANNCCYQASQPSVEHVLIEICDDFITKENEELKEEVERLRRDLIQWKGKCNAQPSQDNRKDMVKKLEKGSTEACIKPHQEGHKSNSAKVKGKFEEVQSVQNAAV